MSDRKTVTLLAGGDVGPMVEPAERLVELISPVLRQADLRFAHCDRTYSEHAAAQGRHGHPHPRLASIWQAAGIDVISVAGNHLMNSGPEALLETIELLRGMGKHVIGAGSNIDAARKPAIVDCNGVKVAFLAYCSILREGDEAGPKKTGIAPMRARTYYLRGGDDHFHPGTPQEILTVPYEDDLQALREDIGNAKHQADVVVMSIHWGLHHIPKAIATYQPVVAHAAIDAGADLILGHHAHCLKAVEVYKGKVCFYSLGNFMITSGLGKLMKPSSWNRWNLWWYNMDPEYMPPHATYHYPPDSRKTMIAKVVFSKNGVERVSCLPAFINPQAQPALVPPSDPKFKEILEYMEWISDQYPHNFRVDGNEIVVSSGP